MKTFKVLLFCVVSSIVGVAAIPAPAFAVGSWTSGTFAFGEEEVITPNYEEGCDRRMVSIGSPFSLKKSVCVYDRPTWRYGFYTEVSGPPYAPTHNQYLVVGIGADSGMYKVINPGYSQSYQVVHIPGTDDFVYNQLTAGFTNNHALYIARDYPSKLTRSYSGFESVYTLADNSFEPLIKGADGLPVTTGEVGVSGNGRWIAAEVMGVGLVQMDTETYQKRLFSNYKHRYGLGSDAHIRFVISEDGRYIATFDYNIQPKVYSLSDSCVVSSHDFEAIRSRAGDYVSCPDDEGRLHDVLATRFGAQVARSMSAEAFNYDADTLYFNRMEFPGPEVWEPTVYRLPLHAGDYQPETTLEYLALGDSYASGEGDIERVNDTSYYLSGTDYIGGCHISSRSYPLLLSAKNNLPSDRMHTVACSGAQIFPDYLGRVETYPGQDERLLKFSEEERPVRQREALDNFTPGMVPQLEFVKKYQPRVVTLMGGGNDVGFSRILEYCASPSWEGVFVDDTCGYAIDGSELRSMLGASIRDQYAYTRKMLAMIREVSPRTVVYILGYPSFISDNPIDSCLNSAALDLEERKMINEAVTYMNTVLKRSAETSGAYFIDIENSLAGGRMCEGSEYMTGFWQVGINRVINEDVQEMFHPNAKAHQQIADRAHSEGFSLHAVVPASSQDTGVPQLSDYFGGSTANSITAAKQYQISPASEISELSNSSISVGVSSFQPGSSVMLTMYSSPVQLGVFQVANDGSLNGTFTLPDSIKPGRHVLVLDGTSASGEAVRFFQFMTVTSPDSTDKDADGVTDNQDACMFMTEWFDEKTGENVCAPKEEPKTPIPNAPLSINPLPIAIGASRVSEDQPTSIVGFFGNVLFSTFADTVEAENKYEETEDGGQKISAATDSRQVLSQKDKSENSPTRVFFMTIGLLSAILVAIKLIRRHYENE